MDTDYVYLQAMGALCLVTGNMLVARHMLYDRTESGRSITILLFSGSAFWFSFAILKHNYFLCASSLTNTVLHGACLARFAMCRLRQRKRRGTVSTSLPVDQTSLSDSNSSLPQFPVEEL